MARSTEIRLWWPLPLAALVWLAIIWGVGFLLTTYEIQNEAPQPIEARFVEFPEAEQDQTPTTESRQGSQPQSQPQPQPQLEETQTAAKPAHQPPPVPRHSPPERPKINPKAIEKVEINKALPENTNAKTATPPAADAAAPTDLSDFINQARARRQAAGIFDNQQNTQKPTTQSQPSEEDIRMARIKRNLQAPGTSGIFQITSIGNRYAQFTFRAWTTGVSTSNRRETVTVDAGIDGDVERAIIRRMIQLIRQHHKEDFNWESHRLNRVVVLSARMGDNEGLEEFLMREFFDEFTGIYR
ncbi:MAG: hypothetical protein OEX82_08280 [Nitrosomonas sp.]|nr:hypothetical protein [Nitrosomonas sp.]